MRQRALHGAAVGFGEQRRRAAGRVIPRLALAFEKAGDIRSARSAVLAALEIAPNYTDAQDLLLRLRELARGDGT